MANDILMSLLSPQQREQAQEDALRQGLLGLSMGLIQASQPQGNRRTSTLQALAQAAPGAVRGYQSSFDQTLKDILTRQQVEDLQRKRQDELAARQRQQAIQKVLPALYQNRMGQVPMTIPTETYEDFNTTMQGVIGRQIDPERLRELSMLGPEGRQAAMQAIEFEKALAPEPKLGPGVVGEFQSAKINNVIPPTMTLSEFVAMKKPPGTTVNVGDRMSPFQKKTEEAQAVVFNDLVKAGQDAARKLPQINRLENTLSRVETGGAAAFKQIAGNFGIKTEGLDDIQAAVAIINRLVPEQRAPGSGPMSDADLAGFKESLPRIINTPGANQKIIKTMKEINQYIVEEGKIAAQVQSGKLSIEEGQRKLMELGNPVQDFFESQTPRGPVAQPNSQDRALIERFLPRR